MTLQIGRRSTVNSKIEGSLASDVRRSQEDTSVEYIFEGNAASEYSAAASNLQNSMKQDLKHNSEVQGVIIEDADGENRESRDSGFQIAVVQTETD